MSPNGEPLGVKIYDNPAAPEEGFHFWAKDQDGNYIYVESRGDYAIENLFDAKYGLLHSQVRNLETGDVRVNVDNRSSPETTSDADTQSSPPKPQGRDAASQPDDLEPDYEKLTDEQFLELLGHENTDIDLGSLRANDSPKPGFDDPDYNDFIEDYDDTEAEKIELEQLFARQTFEDNQNAPDTLQALEDFTGKDFDDLDATFGIEGLTWADGDLEDPFAEYDEDSPDYQPPTPGEIDLLGNINQLIDSSDLLNGQVLSDIGGLITDSGITDLDIIDDIGRLASQGGENLFGVLGEIRELAFNNPLGDIDVLNDVTNLIDTVGISGDAVLGGVNRLVQRSGLTDTVAVRRVGQLLNQRGVVQVAAQAAGQFAEAPLSFARDLGNIEVIDDIEAFSKVKDRTQSFLTQQTPNGWVLMMLGKYMFSLSNAAYQQMTRSIEYRWPAEARIGRRPALQFVGTGQETISLSGSIYPSYAGGLRQIDAMRELAGSGEPLILMDGLGYNHQEWCIVRIKETSRMVLENSAPRRVDFELELSRYGRDTVESDASQVSL